jgi:TolB-like protein/DNA-binding winged helix-turn-helix (wHTH) protein/Flp pilus assembly protein TadD
MADSPRWSIGDWTFDSALNRLSGTGGTVVLTPLAARVLEYLARHPGEVISNDELIEHLWRRREVGDAPVYRVIADLRHALNDDARNPRYIKTVRKRGYRLLAPVDWLAEEDTKPQVDTASGEAPDDFNRDQRDRAAQRAPDRDGFRPYRLAAAILAALVALFLIERVFQPTHDEVVVADNTLAVIPFTVVSGDRDDEYYADGISEVLIHQLAQIPDLKVTARTSAFAYKGQNIDVRTIGRQLGVANILEGSVQRSNGRIRVLAQLIDTGNGMHIWSDQYDRLDQDIFKIQDDIATRVAMELSASLSANSEAPPTSGIATENLEAYDEFLKGLDQLRIASFESPPRALEHFNRAIALDPDFNEARLKLLETYNAQNYVFQIDYAELAVRNQTIPREILARNPNSARAFMYLAKADFSLHFPTGSGEAERLFNKALRIAPRDPVILWNYAYLLAWNDKPDEAVAALEKALEVDPYSPRALASAARQGYPDHAATLRERYPRNPQGWGIAGELAIRDGDLASALEFFLAAERKSPRDPEFPAMAAIVLLTAGLLDDAEGAVERARSKGVAHPTTIAAGIALAYRRHGIDVAGEQALNALRNNLPPRQFSFIVTQLLALRHSLKTGRPLDYVEAAEQWLDTPGTGGRSDLRDPTIKAPTTFGETLILIPAFRAAGETEVADQLLASAQDYFDNASESLRYHETGYALQLLSGDVESALDTLEMIIDSPRSGFLRNAMNNPTEYRWWLEFEGELAAALAENPRYHEIMARREEWLVQEREAIRAILKDNDASAQRAAVP